MSNLEFYKKKFLGFMTPDQVNEVKVTDRGFVYKGNLIVSIPNLSSEVEKVIEQYEKIEPVILEVEKLEKVEAAITEAEKIEEPVIQVEVKKEVVKAAPRKLNKKK